MINFHIMYTHGGRWGHSVAYEPLALVDCWLKVELRNAYRFKDGAKLALVNFRLTIVP